MLHFIIVLGSGRCVRCCFDGYVVVCVMTVAVLGGDVCDVALCVCDAGHCIGIRCVQCSTLYHMARCDTAYLYHRYCVWYLVAIFRYLQNTRVFFVKQMQLFKSVSTPNI